MPDELLEIHDADGAFERLETWLTERGFFSGAADDLFADVYLGYGLSEAIRRDGRPPPPEPCPQLPLVACRLASEDSEVGRADSFGVGE